MQAAELHALRGDERETWLLAAGRCALEVPGGTHAARCIASPALDLLAKYSSSLYVEQVNCLRWAEEKRAEALSNPQKTIRRKSGERLIRRATPFGRGRYDDVDEYEDIFEEVQVPLAPQLIERAESLEHNATSLAEHIDSIGKILQLFDYDSDA